MYSLLIVIYLAFISLGLPDSLLGSAWPVMQRSFGVPISYAGIVTMIISAGTIVSSLMSDRLTSKLGTRAVTVGSVFLTAAALFGFSVSKSFFSLCLWGIPYGLGAGAIDAALNNYVALHYSSRHMSWLHCFWGVGTIVSPYIMSRALAGTGWQSGYRAVSMIQLAITLILIFTLPLWKVHKSGAKDSGGERVKKAKNPLKIRGVPQLLAGFFSYSAVEAALMLWTSSYLVRARSVPEETAAACASLFFIGITAGRFVSGIVSDRLGDRRLIRVGACVMGAGIICVALPLRTNIAALAGFVVAGIGCAPIYPSIIHSTPENFGEENSQSVIGLQMAGAYVGTTFMPPLFGLIANHISIRLLPAYLAVFAVIMIVMLETAYNKSLNK